MFQDARKKSRDAPTINVVGKLVDLMLGKVISPKYLDLGSLIVDVHINNTVVPNTLIDLGVTINVMTRETILKLNLLGALKKTMTLL